MNSISQRIIFLITLFLIYLPLFAENNNNSEPKRERLTAPTIVKDTASWQVIYTHISIDPVLKERKADYEMLSVGKNFSWYGGYGDYQLDSIQRVDPEGSSLMSFEDFRKLYRELEPISEHLNVDYKNSTVNYYGKISINYFRYSEPLPEIEWTLDDEETETVMGYECSKATARWRGRDWTAWYCEIPYSGGPWKFNGLPGLILKLEDSTGEHRFEAIATKDDVYPIGYRDRLYSRSTREKYEATFKDQKVNAGKWLIESGMVEVEEKDREWMSKRRLFYSPIELE